MYYEVAAGLLLDGAEELVEVSQAVELGKDTNVTIRVWATEGTLATGAGLAISAEGSIDLDQWVDLGYNYQSTLFEAPGNTFIPAYSATSAIPFRFVRLRYTLQSASVKALFGASIFTWTLS